MDGSYRCLRVILGVRMYVEMVVVVVVGMKMNYWGGWGRHWSIRIRERDWSVSVVVVVVLVHTSTAFFYFSYCYNYLSSILRVDDW